MTAPLRPTVWPVLRYADPQAAIRFLVGAFGFEESLVVPGEEDGSIVHAELLWPGGGGVMIGTATGRSAPTAVYVVTSEPDELFDRARAAGAGVESEPSDEDYGSRGFVVTDPEGNRWSFGTYPGA
jgi:uncharacterized glyoxalase superfamily protein PhnB